MNGIRYSASWAIPDTLAVYLKGDVVVAISAPNAPPDAPYDHIILSGNVHAELKRSCMELGFIEAAG